MRLKVQKACIAIRRDAPGVITSEETDLLLDILNNVDYESVAYTRRISVRQTEKIERSALLKLKNHKTDRRRSEHLGNELESVLSSAPTDGALYELGDEGYRYFRSRVEDICGDNAPELAEKIISSLKEAYVVRDFYRGTIKNKRMPVDKMGLPSRTVNQLHSKGIYRAEDFSLFSEDELAFSWGISKNTAKEIGMKLMELGVSYRK